MTPSQVPWIWGLVMVLGLLGAFFYALKTGHVVLR